MVRESPTPPTCTPRVSIGLPVYNGERFLAQSFRTFAEQTLGDFELIVSDNASTDGTAALCEEQAARDPRIRYVRQAVNIGAPRNWSFVVTLARGRYFKWASVNDWCDPRLLERCVATLEARPDAVLVQPRVALADEAHGAVRDYDGDFELAHATPSERFVHLMAALKLNNAQSGVIRLDVLRQTGLDRPYPGGDIPLMAELALRGAFVLLPEVMLYRRMGPTTFSRGLAGAAQTRFYGSASSDLMLVLKRSRDLTSGIWRAPIAWQEKRRCLAYLGRLLAWEVAGEWRAWRARGTQPAG